MELNSMIFPVPKKRIDAADYKGEIIWVPVKKSFLSNEDFQWAYRNKNQRVILGVTKANPPAYLTNPTCHSFIHLIKSTVFKEQDPNDNRLDFSIDLVETNDNPFLPSKKKVPTTHNKPSKFLSGLEIKNPSLNKKKDSPLKMGSIENFETPDEHEGINRVNLTPCLKPISLNSKYLKYDLSSSEEINELVDRYIPCLLLLPLKQTSKLVVFYHANGEDLADARYFCQRLNHLMDVV